MWCKRMKCSKLQLIFYAIPTPCFSLIAFGHLISKESFFFVWPASLTASLCSPSPQFPLLPQGKQLQCLWLLPYPSDCSDKSSKWKTGVSTNGPSADFKPGQVTVTYLPPTINGLLEPEVGFVFLGRAPGHSILFCHGGEGRIMAVMSPKSEPPPCPTHSAPRAGTTVGLIKHLQEFEMVSRELGCCKNLDTLPCPSHPSFPGVLLFLLWSQLSIPKLLIKPW